jgi:hypothetical protein
MPTYYARGVTVRLGVNPLADTITPSIILKKGDVAKKQCEKPEKELLNGHLLPEQRVDFPGDEHGFELNWLGDAPFMQARVGDSLFEGATSSNAVQTAPLANSARLRRQPAKESYNAYGYEPLALSLHVMTSDTTFVSGMDRQNKLQLKIEVFFNGQLSSCLFLPPYEIRSNTKTHHQVFAGYRIDYLVERPWVILPPHTAADGSPVKSDKLLSAKQRWKDISAALSREASQRGTDSQGNIPPSSHFLGALATSRMPDQVVAWQKPGCRHFGVIDVVITAGEGRKVTSGATYLTRPQRFTDENFPLSNVGGFDEDAEGESDSDYEPLPKRQALNPPFPVMSCGPEYIQAPLSHNKAVFQSIQETPMCHLSSTSPQFPATETLPFGPDRSIHELSRFSHDPSLSSERGPASYMKHSSNTGHTVRVGAASTDFQSQVPMRFGEQERRDSVDSAFAPSFIPNASYLWPPLLDLRRHSHVPASSPRHFPNMVSSTTPVGHQDVPAFGGLPFLAPHDRRFSMLLPPTGFFTVPVKPRPSLSPMKKSRPTNLRMPQRGFLLKRLIIVGKGGVMLVDHEWPIAQHIAVNEHPAGHCGSNVPQKSSVLASTEGVLSSDTLFHDLTSSGTAQSDLLPAKASAQSRKAPYELTKDESKRASSTRATNGQSIPRGHRSDIKDGGITSLDSVVRTDSALPSQKVEGNARDVAHSLLPKRRTTAATTILGVQGPKAITFLYDDPEAMIREEKRNARRSKSPMKSKDKTSTIRKFKTSAPDEIAAPAKDMGALSSPLSNLATTPEVGYEPKAKSTAIILSSSAEAGPLPQVDGSPAHKIDTTSSPTAANIARSSPQFPVPPASSTPRDSPSSNAKMRKNGSGRYLAKQPRSPDRLKTTSNPLLSRDCVIAFAESQDKESERGVLRQIKSERQGVFAEEHVVFATRFYVAGN